MYFNKKILNSMAVKPGQAVFAVTAVFLGWALGGPLMGDLFDRFDHRRFILCVGSSGAALCLSLALFLPLFNYFTVCFLLFLFGLLSASQILNFVYAIEISPKEFSATAIAMTNMIVIFGAACSQPVVGWLLDLNWSNGLSTTGMRIYTVNNFRHAFIILPIALILSSVLSLFLKSKNRR